MIEAVIFDLDGTVLDNEGEWEEAFCEVAKKFSVTNSGFSIDGWMHEPGIGITPNWRRYFPSDLAKVDELSRETWEAYKLKTQEVKVKIREWVEKLVEKIKARGWMTALTTGSSWHVVEGELEELGLYLAFDVTTTGEEVLVQKPDPEIYLLTVQKLGLEPGECVVVEDAVAGVRAAVEAGCLSVGLESAYAPEKLLKSAGATWVVKEMGEVADLITRT